MPSPRVTTIANSMTLSEKAAALCCARTVANDDGSPWEGTSAESPFGFVPATELLVERGISSVLLMNAPPAEAVATWHNAVQALGRRTRLALPVQVASDPRHSRSFNVQTNLTGSGFSRFPEPVGFAAAFDPDLVEESARVMARELRACGISVAVHPMADLATDARWARIAGTFGEDPDHAGATAAAWVRGLQGGTVGSHSVAATVKHFPGGGPQRGGEDSHFAEGAHTVYPGGRFETHLAPFTAALAAGALRVMPGYAAPLGTGHDAVGFAFARSIITDLLRDRLGFDGVVVTDFNVVTGMTLPRLGIELPVRAWGLEHTTPVERVGLLFAAGVDQLGGEDDPGLVVDAVEAGLVTEERLTESVIRVLHDRELLGLLDDAEVDPARAAVIGLDREHVEVALRAQRASVVALTGERAPGTRDMRVWAEGVDAAVLAGYASIAPSPAEADLAIVRLAAPFTRREGLLEQAFHGGTLEFPEAEIVRLQQLCAMVPTVVDVFLERPVALPEIADAAHALLGTFGVDDEVLLDAVFGRSAVTGRLPFDLPRSTDAVARSREDVPFDTEDPVFRFGDGRTWAANAGTPVTAAASQPASTIGADR